MTSPTVTTDDYMTDPFYCLGRADAYDEHKDGVSVHDLRARAELLLDNAPRTEPMNLYAAGYGNTVIGIFNNHMAQIRAQAEVAQTSHARKQGRELSTRHQRNQPRRPA
ncbi:hypothetical protein [Streptomyces sp. NPDC008150]|uniref:hypothetical protein n=1 Tax=Streptomyces sp. NPDC008150 TaxID=3364816 RepID=UPI0036E9EC7B